MLQWVFYGLFFFFNFFNVKTFSIVAASHILDYTNRHYISFFFLVVGMWFQQNQYTDDFILEGEDGAVLFSRNATPDKRFPTHDDLNVVRRALAESASKKND
eukprot:Rmarinus@m.10271